MKILVAIPCLFGANQTKEAIESVINKKDVDVLLVDNGAESSVKDVLEYYKKRPNVYFIKNKNNIFVNPVWNQIINYFITLNTYINYDYLILMNSDLIMQEDWDIILKNRWKNNSNDICIPNIINDKHFSNINIVPKDLHAKIVHEGTPGVFITLNKEQVSKIYPISEDCKIWFGDNWIYGILRALDYQTVIPDNLYCYHYWSQSVQRVSGISEMIEKDKVQWETKVNQSMLNKIQESK